MGIQIVFAMAEPLGTRVVGVAQIGGHGEGAARSDFGKGGVDGDDGAVALWGGGDVESGFSDGDARFGPADELGGMERCGGQD